MKKHTVEIPGVGTWPRRASIPHQHIAEQAITDAVRQVEMIGASTTLSSIALDLINAREALADELEARFADQLQPPESTLPHLWRALTLLDEDAGVEHTNRIERGYIRPRAARLRDTLRTNPTSFELLRLWDAWLGALDAESFAQAICGEEMEQRAQLAHCPSPGLDEFLTAYWEMP